MYRSGLPYLGDVTSLTLIYETSSTFRTKAPGEETPQPKRQNRGLERFRVVKVQVFQRSLNHRNGWVLDPSRVSRVSGRSSTPVLD